MIRKLVRWTPIKREHAYECYLTEFGDEHGYTDEQMKEYCSELRHQEGQYALSEQFDTITEMETDFHLYWASHDHAPFDPFASH